MSWYLWDSINPEMKDKWSEREGRMERWWTRGSGCVSWALGRFAVWYWYQHTEPLALPQSFIAYICSVTRYTATQLGGSSYTRSIVVFFYVAMGRLYPSFSASVTWERFLTLTVGSVGLVLVSSLLLLLLFVLLFQPLCSLHVLSTG